MDSQKLRVLIIEDNKLAAQTAMLVISAIGYLPDIAYNGAEALAQFKQHYHKLIFVDLGLPDMNGFELTKKIRTCELKQHQHIIVALTAHTSEACKEKSLDAGMNDFIPKPITIDKLKQVIQKYAQPLNLTVMVG